MGTESTTHRFSAGAAAIAVVAVLAAGGLAGCGGASSARSSSSATTAPSTTSSPSTSTPARSTSTTQSTSTGAQPPLSTRLRGALTVAPLSGRPGGIERFTVHLALVAAARAGLLTQAQLSVARTSPAGASAGCVSLRTVLLPLRGGAQAQSDSEQLMLVSLGPAQLGGPWCRGTFTARVEVLQRPACRRGQMCPQFIRLIGVLGPVRFRIA